MKYKYFFYHSVLIFITLLHQNCQDKQIYTPISHTSNKYIDTSKKYSKAREDQERTFLEKWVQKQQDSLGITYQSNSDGIWIRFIKKQNTKRIKENDKIIFTAIIKDITGKIIYTESEFGIKNGHMGKFKEIRGIESALYKMGKNEETEIIIPSFFGYGFYGDENKIGSNIPLIINLHVIDVEPL